MHEHRLKFDRQSTALVNGRHKIMDIYKCLDCNKLSIIDNRTGKIINLNGKMREEINYG